VTLANGMRFLLLPRPGTGTVEAGWVVRAGTADEPPGAGGAAHAVEHLLFQGTRTIAARDPVQELPLLEREDALAAELDRLEAEAAAQPQTEGGRLARLRRRVADLAAEAAALVERLRTLVVPGELAYRYSQAGGTGLNANTAHDFTVFYVTVPAEALELWFWLESDRLLDPVFREFEREKAVIREERRLRVDSTPTGRAEEALARRFWGEGAYATPTLGDPEDLDRLRRPAARRFFAERYGPDRLTAALVGDFDPGQARAWAERYFARLTPAAPPTPGRAVAPPAPGGPWTTGCACPDQARVLYRTVPLDHPDTTALQLLAGVFNGRSGRLYRSLVVERELAFAAFAQQTSFARAGAFEVTLEAKGGRDPLELVTAWDEELARLLTEPIPATELERARNVLAAEALRQLREPALLLRRLLIYDALGDWRLLAGWPERLQGIEEGEVRAVGERYLGETGRFVAVFEREEAAR
jgi:predicted Zn-dependent peptidase